MKTNESEIRWKSIRKWKWKKFDLNKDSSVGKECEENDANHGETPNLQSRKSYNKNEFLKIGFRKFFWRVKVTKGWKYLLPTSIGIWCLSDHSIENANLRVMDHRFIIILDSWGRKSSWSSWLSWLLLSWSSWSSWWSWLLWCCWPGKGRQWQEGQFLQDKP